MNNNKKKIQNIYKVIMLLVISITVTFIATSIFMYKRFESEFGVNRIIGLNGENNEASNKNLLAKLEIFKSMLKQNYIGELDENKMLEYAMKGYIAGLGDIYTEYFTKEEMEEFMEDTNGEYVGIGVYLTNNKAENEILVIGIMKDSPAEKAGMQVGDVIIKANDTEFNGDKLDDLIKVLKGKEGTTAKVTVKRKEENIDLTVERKKINVEHVSSANLDNGIGYIKIDAFDKGVAKSFKEHKEKLEKEGAKKLLLDLRSNGGGIVNEATDIADFFLEKDETIMITKSKKKDEEIIKSKKAPIIKDTPVVVLVNEGTASASEILTGALKDKYKNITIVGKKTYGKGVIQVLLGIKDGSGLKITTEEYFTPNHNKINEIGINPDVEVDLTKDKDGYYEIGFEKDAQLLKAKEILLNK